MANISDYNLYDFNKLNQTWKTGGWKALSEFCNALGFTRDLFEFHSDINKSKSTLICYSVDAILYEISEGIDVRKLIYLVLVVKNKKLLNENSGKRINDEYFNILWGKGQKNKGVLRTILAVLSKSRSSEEIINTLGTKEIYDKINPYHYVINCVLIKKRWSDAFAWLLKAVDNEVSEEEAWWNCAWLFIQDGMEDLLRMRKLAEKQCPISENDIRNLNWYYWEGHPILQRIEDEYGKWHFGLPLELNVNAMSTDGLHMVSTVALAQPAFLLSQFIKQQYSVPKYEKVCRSPHCQKVFLTGRANATSCPGSQGNKKNKCALEWVRYNRYLQKIRKDPEKNWNDDKLKQQFIDYDSA